MCGISSSFVFVCLFILCFKIFENPERRTKKKEKKKGKRKRKRRERTWILIWRSRQGSLRAAEEKNRCLRMRRSECRMP